MPPSSWPASIERRVSRCAKRAPSSISTSCCPSAWWSPGCATRVATDTATAPTRRAPPPAAPQGAAGGAHGHRRAGRRRGAHRSRGPLQASIRVGQQSVAPRSLRLLALQRRDPLLATAAAAILALLMAAGVKVLGTAGLLLPLVLILAAILITRPLLTLVLVVGATILCEGAEFGLFSFTSHLYIQVYKDISLLDMLVALVIVSVLLDVLVAGVGVAGGGGGAAAGGPFFFFLFLPRPFFFLLLVNPAGRR